MKPPILSDNTTSNVAICDVVNTRSSWELKVVSDSKLLVSEQKKPPGNEIGLHVAYISLCDHGNKGNHTATGSQVLILGRRVHAN